LGALNEDDDDKASLLLKRMLAAGVSRYHSVYAHFSASG
jgi:hypothetical protein